MWPAQLEFLGECPGQCDDFVIKHAADSRFELRNSGPVDGGAKFSEALCELSLSQNGLAPQSCQLHALADNVETIVGIYFDAQLTQEGWPEET